MGDCKNTYMLFDTSKAFDKTLNTAN